MNGNEAQAVLAAKPSTATLAIVKCKNGIADSKLTNHSFWVLWRKTIWPD